MKCIKYLLMSLLGVFFLFSCKKSAFREGPIFSISQPIGVKEETGFAKRYWGEYISMEDTAFSFLISSNMIKTKYVNYSKVPKISFDTMPPDEKIEFNKLKASGKLFAYIKKDTIYYKMVQIDTVFSLEKEDLLRYKQGEYYLNTKSEYGFYIQRIQLIKNKMLVMKSVIYSEDSIMKYFPTIKLDSVITENGEVRFATLNPSKLEFTKLMKNKDLYSENYYSRKVLK